MDRGRGVMADDRLRWSLQEGQSRRCLSSSGIPKKHHQTPALPGEPEVLFLLLTRLLTSCFARRRSGPLLKQGLPWNWERPLLLRKGEKPEGMGYGEIPHIESTMQEENS